MKNILFWSIESAANQIGLELIAAQFNGRHVSGQVATLVARNAAGDTFPAYQFKCIESGNPQVSRWDFAPQGDTIQREAIKVIPPDGQHNFTRYEWLCPQCATSTHGDSRSDSIFEIRNDPLCIYCRVKRGQFRFNGSKFVRTEKEVLS